MDQIWWTFLKMLIALPMVLILVLVVLRYNLKGFYQRGGQNRTMRVRDRLMLDKNSSIYIVEVQEQFYLLGCQQNHMVLLDKLDNYHWDQAQGAEKVEPFESLLVEKLAKFSHSLAKQFRMGKGKQENDE